MISCNVRNFALARSFKGGFCGFVARFFFHNDSSSRTSISSIPNTVCLSNTSSHAKIFPNPASRVVVKSRILSRKFCVFPNPTLYFGQLPDLENTLPDPVFFNPAPRDGSKLERNEKCCNFYCSSPITLVFPLFNPVLCGDPIFSIIIPKFTSYPGSSPKWSETRLARFLKATRM